MTFRLGTENSRTFFYGVDAESFDFALFLGYVAEIRLTYKEAAL